MKPIFIAVSGGSGAGKSTLCTTLLDAYPEKIGLLQLDDYFKKEQDGVPVFQGFVNWDHPNALRFEQLYKDLIDLQQRKDVLVWTKNERLNPDYKKTDQRIQVMFHPKPIMLVEGYLVLHDSRIRELMTASFWLDIDQEKSWQRRVHFKTDGYLEQVLLPMNEKFVQPLKQYVNHIIKVTDMKKEEVFKEVQKILEKESIL